MGCVNNTVDYGVIKKRVQAGKTQHEKELPHLYAFALRFAGGQNPWLLDDTYFFVARIFSSVFRGPSASCELKAPTGH